MSVPSVSIENKNGVVMLIDEEDLRFLKQHKAGHWCFYITPKGYVQIRHSKDLGGNKQNTKLHRLIMKAPVGLEIDHVSRNKLDNRKENLRFCTRSQNVMNTAVRGASRFRGVSKKNGKWQSDITTNGIKSYLGFFKTEIEAAQAYDAAARLRACDFSTLNFPDEVTNA